MSSRLRPDALASALASTLAPGSTLDAVGGRTDVTVVGVDARADDVLVRFRWLAYPHLLGCALGADGPYGPVDTAAEWAADARIWLLEELGTGLVARGTRTSNADVIELSPPDWPRDRRFHLAGFGLDTGREDLAAGARDGFDVATPTLREREGTLLSWQRAFVDGPAGGPMVGHATASRVDAVTGRLDHCEVVTGAPDTVTLALCWAAVHAASWRGVRHVVTDLDHPVLDVLGFERDGRSRVVDTRFASMDHAAAARLVGTASGRRFDVAD